MSEKLKLGVAVALVVAVAAVFVVRTRSALEDAGDEISGTDNWQITVEDHTPSPVKWDASRLSGFDAEPTGPHLRIATFRVTGPVTRLREISADSGQHFLNVRQRMTELHANAYVHEGVDDQVPGLVADQAELIEGIYLIHAGEVGEPYRSQLGKMACQITSVTPGSPAEVGGMKVGDVMVDLDDAGIAEASGKADNPCRPINDAMKSLPPNQPGQLLVLRDGVPVTLTVSRPGTKFGFDYLPVPILSAW